MDKTKKTGGVSLAKGPVAVIALALLAYGITALLMGGHSFAMHPPSGTVNGKAWLGLEVNAWSSLLFIAAGALLLLSAPAHWSAKGMSMLVGLALIAAALIALYDKTDVLGIFAANGLTELVWSAAGVLLILLSLLPRVGRKTTSATRRREHRPGEREQTRERQPAIRLRRDAARQERTASRAGRGK